MELNKKKLTEELAISLQRDVGSFAKKLPCETKGTALQLSQSRILLECELPSPSCETGERLMIELLRPCATDIIVKVGGEAFLCHRELLSSRSEYFNAMLKNKWSEAESQEITLNNVKAESFAALLCFFYGASAEMPKFCTLLDVLQISDMFGVTGLTDVVKLHIKIELCHSFHRPCKVCVSNIPEVLQLAGIFSLNDVTKAVTKWNIKFFQKLWPTKGFASLQEDVREKCLKAVVQSLSLENAVHLLMETDKLLSSITRVQWTKPVVAMGTELMTSCCDFISSNILELTTNKTIIVLFQGMGWKVDIVEQILLQIGDTLTIENVGNAHIAIGRLLFMGEKEKWIQEFPKMLLELKKKIWNFLVSNYYAVIHTEPWQHVSSADKMTLKSAALCHGDENRKLTKRPVLSSSLHKKPPTPSVLKRQPMKIKPRKQTKNTKVPDEPPVEIANCHQPTEEPPQRKPAPTNQEVLQGGYLCEVIIEPRSLLNA